MEANTWKERIIMPIQNGKYVSPNWQNGGPPALNAAELNAICQSLQADDQQIKDNLPGIIQSIASGVFLNSSGHLVNKAGSQITIPSSQLSDQVHIVTGSYVGTGTYGADHPCSLTFDFLPKLIFVFAYYENPDPGGSSARYIPLGNGIENHDEDACLCVLDTSKIGTDYTAGFGLGYIHSANSLWAKKSPDGKTVSWYNTYNSRLGPEMYQFNTSGWEFFFGAIG